MEARWSSPSISPTKCFAITAVCHGKIEIKAEALEFAQIAPIGQITPGEPFRFE
jgi:hypothetical protein